MKKGQVTIFIIIGLVIILIAGIFLFLRNSLQSDEDILDYTPEELLPLERYMVNCLEQVGKQGLLIMGKQGGYITLPQNIYSSPRSYVQDLTAGGFKTPLWKVNGVYEYPDLDEVNNQLGQYIEENIELCVQDAITLETIDELQIISEPQAEVSINEEDVSVILDFEIKSITENRQTTYDKYGVRIPVKMYDILRTASFILQKNDEDTFLAESTVNIMSLDPDIPIGDLRFSCEPQIWSKTQIERQLQDYLTFMIPRVRLSGTNFQPFQENVAVYQRIQEEWDVDRIAAEGLPSADELPDDSYDFMQQYWNIGSYDYNGLHVGFVYAPSYGMAMNVNPSSGDVVKAIPGRSSSKYLRYLCMNIYHFTYDITYPVKISIYDSSAFEGDGYSFSFAAPVHIDHNIPSSTQAHFATRDAIDTDENFCKTTSDDITYVVAKDYYTNEYLSDVDIRYDCIKYYCDLGTVSTEHNYGIPELHANLPLGCANGFYIAEKPGYLRYKSQEPGDDSAELLMVPLRDFRYAVFDTGTGRPFTDEYRASIHIKSTTHDFEGFYSFPPLGNQDNILQLIDAPETYELNIFLYANGNIVGGWIGNWSTTQAELDNDAIAFFPIEWADMVSHATPEKTLALYQYLENNPANDPYREQNRPEFR